MSVQLRLPICRDNVKDTMSWMCQGESAESSSRPEVIKLDGDVLLIGCGTLSSITVNGTWFYVRRDKQPEEHPLLSREKLSGMRSLNLDNLPLKSSLEIDGDLYFYPDACLLQEDWGAYLAVSDVPEMQDLSQ